MKKSAFTTLLFLAFVFTLSAQEISFSFTANYGCEYAPLDSVLVENITQGGDTVLYYPDTVLSVLLTGIDMQSAMADEFFLSQNYPNPFSSKTRIDVFVPEQDNFTISVFDITGRQIATYENRLEKGMHNFTFTAGNSKNYLLTVNSAKYAQRKLMISVGADDNPSASLTYNGMIPEKKTMQKTTRSYFAYEVGDELKFTGFVDGDFEDINDTPSSGEDYVFEIINTIPASATAGTQVVDIDQIEWNWNAVSGATGYKYNTVDDYATATDNGSTTTYTQTGLSCETSYTLYVWAYNGCGESLTLGLTETTDDCPFSVCGENEIVEVTSLTGEIWMDRNLGASQQATSSTDYNAYGALFQWGRLSDGHECINWTSSTGSDGVEQDNETAEISYTDNPGHSNFIRDEYYSPYDWRAGQNDYLWQGAIGTNNPCPAGYRLPTETELDNERASWDSNDAAGAYASSLKLPLAGLRDNGGLLQQTGSYGYYWSSTVDGTRACNLYFRSGNAVLGSYSRVQGMSVRCIKD